LIAIPSASGERIRKYLDALSFLNVEVRVLPSLRELAGGRIERGSLRSVQLQDLLRREPIRLDEAEISTVVAGGKILVTGAGGSIGSEICVQLAGHKPAELLALGHGEQSIYDLLQRLDDIGCAAPCRPIIADIADETAMERVFAEYRPDIVFHAGAHKHVPLMEENPREALRVNALGTWIVAKMAGIHAARRVVMISTDKAVHPSSVMGATKRIAERLLWNAQGDYPDTRYIAVRFGNVLGSRGSVVPLFEKQIMKGGPVTVTHPDMRRYFMLIPEAVSLVLQAASMGKGGELYVLDMGDPVNISEMAETLIKLHGRAPHTDVKIEYTGLRKGEKLFEELFSDPLHVDKTSHEKIFLSRFDGENRGIADEVQRILRIDTSNDGLRRGIFSLASDMP
jgi:FlaA1/EpsC-like NDP-sugar epimerase